MCLYQPMLVNKLSIHRFPNARNNNHTKNQLTIMFDHNTAGIHTISTKSHALKELANADQPINTVLKRQTLIQRLP